MAGLVTEPVIDVERVLASLDTMAARRPVAAQIVSVANAEGTSAKELSAVLASDVTMAGRIMKLSNSAYFGMRGRVSSPQFAVTVVGFTTVRTMATVALTDLDDESRLPADFWDVSSHVALAAAGLAPCFGERPQDALGIGLLAQLGVALLHHNDPEGYPAVTVAAPAGARRWTAEVQRYGIHALGLTAVALEHWDFPGRMVAPLRNVDDLDAPEGGLLRTAFEVAARLCDEDHQQQPIAVLSGDRVTEDDVPPVLETVRVGADELRRALLG